MKRLILLLLPLLFIGFNADAAKKPKWASLVWFLMDRQMEKEKQPNDSVVINCKFIHGHRCPNLSDDVYGMYYPQPHVVISILNNTERDIYVDLQKSSMIVNQERLPLFTNATDISTQGSTAMGGVNLGVIGVGSASSNFSSTVKQEQRYVVVPAETKTSLDFPFMKWDIHWTLRDAIGEFKIAPGSCSNPQIKDYDPPFMYIKQKFVQEWEILTYEATDSPFTLDFRMCYSFNDDMSNSLTTKSVYYTKHAVGGSRNASPKELTKFPIIDSFQSSKNKMAFCLWIYGPDSY